MITLVWFLIAAALFVVPIKIFSNIAKGDGMWFVLTHGGTTGYKLDIWLGVIAGLMSKDIVLDMVTRDSSWILQTLVDIVMTAILVFICIITYTATEKRTRIARRPMLH